MKEPVFYLLIVKKRFSKNNFLFDNAVKLTGKKNESEKLKPFDTPYHVISFNPHSLQYFFKKVGLSVLKQRNFGRKFDFLSYSPKSKSFWVNLLFLFPFEYPGQLIQRDIYFEAYLSKNN